MKPIISYTTDYAIQQFSPEERGCYADGEAILTHLSYSSGFRYEMNNCLIDKLINDIIWNCRCIPQFKDLVATVSYSTFLEGCTSEKLRCANSIMNSFDLDGNERKNFSKDPEAIKSPEAIGNISKPISIRCMPGCREQENANQMSFARYPQIDSFFHQKTFCLVATHVWQVTCLDENRKYFLDVKQPNLCKTLEDYEEYFGNLSSCNTWPHNFYDKNPNMTYEVNNPLSEEIFEYGRRNLALVRIMIQSPYVTKIKRDVAMTFTSYVANAGGLLGLCLGFSFISGIEILFWLCCCFREVKKKAEISAC